jgi:ABC-type polysaccharide/polyol phosphate export permease
MLMSVARHGLRRTYAGTTAGAAWAVLSAVLPFLVIGVVFSVALRARLGGAPYLFGFAAAYVPWVFISGALTDAAGSLLEHRYLVKRVPFQLHLLPTASLVANLLPHAILLAIVIVVGALGGYGGPQLLELPYYLVCMLAVCGGLGLAAAAVSVVLRDASRTMPLVIQVWFWATPIAWDPARAPEAVRTALNLNPAAYVVAGYRHGILPHAFAAPTLAQSLVFWVVTPAILAAGMGTFVRLRPHFWESL